MTQSIGLPNCGIDELIENSVESIMDLDAANNSLRDSTKQRVFLFGTQFNHATEHLLIILSSRTRDNITFCPRELVI